MGCEERRVGLEVHGVRIVAALTVPAVGRTECAVLLIPGSLFVDVDGNLPFMNVFPHNLLDLAHQLAKRGYAVLRFAKMGPGTGSETVDAEAARAMLHFRARVDVARAALDLLEREVPGARFHVLAGHSEGAVVASLTAAVDARVAAVVSLSGPALPLLDIMREQTAAMTPPAGGGAPDLSSYDDVLARIRRGEPLPADAAADPRAAMLAAMDAKSLRYIREIDAVDPAAAIAAVRQPVLVVQGGRDASVREHHGHTLRDARAGLPTELVVFPALQHFYKRVEAGVSATESFALDTESDPAVADAIDRWLRGVAAPDRE